MKLSATLMMITISSLTLMKAAHADWGVNAGSSASGYDDSDGSYSGTTGDMKAQVVALVPNAIDVLQGLPPKAEFEAYREQLNKTHARSLSDQDVAKLIILSAAKK